MRLVIHFSVSFSIPTCFPLSSSGYARHLKLEALHIFAHRKSTHFFLVARYKINYCEDPVFAIMDTLDHKSFFSRLYLLFLDLLSHSIFLCAWLIWRSFFRIKENPLPIPVPTPSSSWSWSIRSHQEPTHQEMKCEETNFGSPFESRFDALLVISMWAIAKFAVTCIVGVFTHALAGITEFGSGLKATLNGLYAMAQDRTSWERVMMKVLIVSVFT